MKVKYRETKGPGLLFELYLKMCQNTPFTDIKYLKFHNKNALTLSNTFLFL